MPARQEQLCDSTEHLKRLLSNLPLVLPLLHHASTLSWTNQSPSFIHFFPPLPSHPSLNPRSHPSFTHTSHPTLSPMFPSLSLSTPPSASPSFSLLFPPSHTHAHFPPPSAASATAAGLPAGVGADVRWVGGWGQLQHCRACAVR
ncbi:unnamed protein product [Closterium sp. Naga37s-1]|nr:unnamed protein product [Closterium sp. Naga37s-1]